MEYQTIDVGVQYQSRLQDAEQRHFSLSMQIEEVEERLSEIPKTKKAEEARTAVEGNLKALKEDHKKAEADVKRWQKKVAELDGD